MRLHKIVLAVWLPGSLLANAYYGPVSGGGGGGSGSWSPAVSDLDMNGYNITNSGRYGLSNNTYITPGTQASQLDLYDVLKLRKYSGSLDWMHFGTVNYSTWTHNLTSGAETWSASEITLRSKGLDILKVSSGAGGSGIWVYGDGITMPDNSMLRTAYNWVEIPLYAGAATPNDYNPAVVWKYNSIANVNTATHAVYGVYYPPSDTVAVSYDVTVPLSYYGDGATMYIVGCSTAGGSSSVTWSILISTVQTMATTDTAYQTISVPSISYSTAYLLYKSTTDVSSYFPQGLAGREIKMVIRRSASGAQGPAVLKKIILRFKTRIGETWE